MCFFGSRREEILKTGAQVPGGRTLLLAQETGKGQQCGNCRVFTIAGGLEDAAF
jgi:hypothetical protein